MPDSGTSIELTMQKIISDDIDTILCGPILRKADINSITVWLALKESKTVTLNIYKPGLDGAKGEKILTGNRDTVELGANLHIVAVTADNKVGTVGLQWGSIYIYDLDIGGKSLNDIGMINELIGYNEFKYPSFALPPEDINKLRIFHGSCRKPHGEGYYDALSFLEPEIDNNYNDPEKRPHQLFLTGDQIYADDVAGVLLCYLTEAGKQLLDWKELLPDVAANDEKLLPTKREKLIRWTAQLSSTQHSSHLIYFQEFCAMYLFVWSDLIWPKQLYSPNSKNDIKDVLKVIYKESELDWFDELFEYCTTNKNDFDRLNSKHYLDCWKEAKIKSKGKPNKNSLTKLFGEWKKINRFYEDLKKVRKIMANIPTYMLFDDHEVTDDWYLNAHWVYEALKSNLGRRIIRNGLHTYTCFQAWGNFPERFNNSGPEKYRNMLLTTEKWRGTITTKEDIDLDIYFGIPLISEESDSSDRQIIKENDMKGGFTFPHHQLALVWHFYVDGPRHRAIFLDSRTWRMFPGRKRSPGLISEYSMKKQLRMLEENNNKDVSIIITAAPIIAYPIVEFLQKKLSPIKDLYMSTEKGEYGDLEAWALEPNTMHQIFELLNTGKKVVLLAGDVHFSYSASLKFWMDNKKYSIVQFTSSALKNEDKDTRNLSNEANWLGKTGIRAAGTMDNDRNRNCSFYVWKRNNKIEIKNDKELFTELENKRKCIPSLLTEEEYMDKYLIDNKPYSRFVTTFYRDNRKKDKKIDLITISENDLNTLEPYYKSLKSICKVQSQDIGRLIIGANNISELTFKFDNEKKEGINKYLWWLPGLNDSADFTQHIVSLINDEDPPTLSDTY